jgi:surface antigen
MMYILRASTATLFTLAVATATLPGCTNQPYTSPEQQAQNACQALGPKALSGAVIGGLAGSAAGAGIGAAAGGGRGAAIGAGIGLIGGLVGGLVTGKHLDARDCAEAQQALAEIRTMPTGQPVSWQSPSGSRGVFTPVSDEYAGPNNTFCRTLNQQATLQGHAPTTSTVVTCRTPDGNYETVKPAQT